MPEKTDGRAAGSYRVRKNRNNIKPGDTFGEWTVSKMLDDGYVLCRCSCGVERPVYRSSLINGNSVSCGHAKKSNNLKRKQAEFIGKTFGKWTVLDVPSSQYLLCRCSCGTIRKILLSSIISGCSKSCGCQRLNGRGEQSLSAMAKGQAHVKAIHDAGLAMRYVNKKINKNSRTGITGVSIYHNKKTGEDMYRAYIVVQRKQIALGLYRDINDAIAARKAAEEKYYQPLQEKVDNILQKLKENN